MNREVLFFFAVKVLLFVSFSVLTEPAVALNLTLSPP